MDPGIEYAVKSKPYGGSFFKADNFVFGKASAGSNWAKGHYSEGSEMSSKSWIRLEKKLKYVIACMDFRLHIHLEAALVLAWEPILYLN